MSDLEFLIIRHRMLIHMFLWNIMHIIPSHELFLYGDLALQQWIDIFNRIRFVCDDFKRYTVRDDNIRQALEEMYLTKLCSV